MVDGPGQRSVLGRYRKLVWLTIVGKGNQMEEEERKLELQNLKQFVEYF